MSVLTDQVEAQGEKIRDLESSLEEHHHKLNSTEEMLQQVGYFVLKVVTLSKSNVQHLKLEQLMVSRQLRKL